MGRHRSDPRGLARILIAALAVILALALLVVGGMALVNALTSDSDRQPPPSGAAQSEDSPATGTRSTGTATRRSSATATTAPLVIKVTGSATNVVVRVSNTGEVLTGQTLATGDIRRYDRAPLDVVANNGASLEVTIYGKVQEPKPGGVRGQWFVSAR